MESSILQICNWKLLVMKPISSLKSFLREFSKFLTVTFIFSILLIALLNNNLQAQNQSISTGSYIINMGITPQTVGNGLKPYGMLYDMISNYNVPVKWVINPTKNKDGIDFIHNSIEYRGGPFIIPAEFRNNAVNARITYWESLGVIGSSTISEFFVPVFQTLYTVPRWTLDLQNGSIASKYFVNASIPEVAYGGSSKELWKTPDQLQGCDDLFVMPHADPKWDTHSNLLYWNENYKGGIWAACHAVSALENMVNPLDRTEQTNFLTKKDNAFMGSSGDYANSNSLLLWGDHNGGNPPYNYRLFSNPVAQFMGNLDAALTNGSEQIFVPRQTTGTTAQWNPSINMLVYDADQSDVLSPNLIDFRNIAGLVVYGRGFENPNRGYVMYEAGHSHNKSTGTANIAAQRAFFNFSILVSNDKVVLPELSSVPDIMTSSSTYNLTFTLPNGFNVGNYSIVWKSSCGGTFSNTNQQSVIFTPPIVSSLTDCNITVTITDACGRIFYNSKSIKIKNCDLNVNRSVNNPSCYALSNGSISMGISGSSGPFTWTWSKSNSVETGSGTGNVISNLKNGTYQVNVKTSGGCSTNFSELLTQPNQLVVNTTVKSYLCPGNFGFVNLAVSGGTAPYTYDWADMVGNNNPGNRSDLIAANYSLVVRDQNGCEINKTALITGPTQNIQASLISKNQITCYGLNDGSMSFDVSGGTAPYTYLWLDGSTNLNRNSLTAGTYNLTITDNNGCLLQISESITQPEKLSLSFLITNPTCPSGTNSGNPDDGSIDLSVTGGTPPYLYNWADLNMPTEPEDRTALPSGNYTVIVQDQNGCNANISVMLNTLKEEPLPPGGINN